MPAKKTTKAKPKKTAARKVPVKKVTVKRASTKKLKKVVTQTVVVPEPVITTPVIPEPAYKEVTSPVNRAKLWLAVTATSVVIAGVWVYTLGNNLVHSNALGDSINATEIDSFMESISSDWNALQANVNTLPTLPTNTNTTTSQASATVPETSTDNLDNLFSDL